MSKELGVRRIEIYTNLLEFRSSISSYYIVSEIDNWVKIRGVEGEYYYRIFGNYAVLVSDNFPLNKLMGLERIDINKLFELLQKPGNVRYVLSLDLIDDWLMTTVENCLDIFPGYDLVNDIVSDFQFDTIEECLVIKARADNVVEGINNIIKGMELYYKIVKEQEDLAVKIAERFVKDKN
ncbi:MAG: hypothetical protein RXR43_04675 [Sulfolobus sp.]